MSEPIDSNSNGDPSRHPRSLTWRRGSKPCPLRPCTRAALALIVSQGRSGLLRNSGANHSCSGLRHPGRRLGPQAGTETRGANLDYAARRAELLANASRWPGGDNLILELDLSSKNLPPGSRVRIGGAILEVTPLAHNGCRDSGPDSAMTPCASFPTRSCGPETSAESSCALCRVGKWVREIPWRSFSRGGEEYHSRSQTRHSRARRHHRTSGFCPPQTPRPHLPPEELASEKAFHHYRLLPGDKLAGCLVLQPGANATSK